MTKPKKDKKFAVCIKNDGYLASLELRKIYQVIPDGKAAAYDQIRIVDESGEDYLYPQDYFMVIELPKSVEKALLLAS